MECAPLPLRSDPFSARPPLLSLRGTDVIQKHPEEQLQSDTVLANSLSLSLNCFISFLSPVACEAVAGRVPWAAETIRAFFFAKMGYHFKSLSPSTSVSSLKSLGRLGRGQNENPQAGVMPSHNEQEFPKGSRKITAIN